MADSLKDIIFNKIVDQILDIVAEMYKQEVENLLNHNKCQKILGLILHMDCI